MTREILPRQSVSRARLVVVVSVVPLSPHFGLESMYDAIIARNGGMEWAYCGFGQGSNFQLGIPTTYDGFGFAVPIIILSGLNGIPSDSTR